MKRVGRPTKYDPSYCDDIVAFFNVDAVKSQTKIITTAKGTVIEEPMLVATPMPYFVDWCMKIGIWKSTMQEWIDKYPDFSAAYMRAKELQERHLSQNALVGNYNPGFAGLAAKNWLGWKDRQDLTSDDKEISNVIRMPAKREENYDSLASE